MADLVQRSMWESMTLIMNSAADSTVKMTEVVGSGADTMTIGMRGLNNYAKGFELKSVGDLEIGNMKTLARLEGQRLELEERYPHVDWTKTLV